MRPPNRGPLRLEHGRRPRRDRTGVVPRSGIVSAGVADAELVAFGIAHEDPRGSVFRQLLLLHAGGAESYEPGGFGVDVGRVNVEVHAVLAGLGFWDLLQEQLRT